jgi:Domain of unknown function (DUF4340)
VASPPRLTMRTTTRNTLLLAAVVIALGAGVYAELRREEGMRPEPLTTLDPQNVKTMTIRCTGCRERRFEHRIDGWWMTQPYPLRADSTVVSRLLAVAGAPIRKTLDAKDYDLAKLGLDKPSVTLQLDETTLEFGGEDPIEHDRYVRVAGKLVRVPDRFGARLMESPEVEIDRHLIDAGATVVEVGIDGAAPRADLAAAWKDVAAPQMQPGDGNDGIKAVVEFADTTKIEFAIRRDNDHYVVHRADIALDYVISEAQAQTLLGKAN